MATPKMGYTTTRLQICPLYMFGNKATDGTYGSKYCFPGFGFDSGPNLQPCIIPIACNFILLLNGAAFLFEIVQIRPVAVG